MLSKVQASQISKNRVPAFCIPQDQNVLHEKHPVMLVIIFASYNKANLRDLIAATGLVILLKLDSNCLFFSRETPNLGKNWPWNLTDDLQKQ